jgi:hypothetical protein
VVLVFFDEVVVLRHFVCVQLQPLKDCDDELFFRRDEADCAHLLVDAFEPNGFMEMIERLADTGANLVGGGLKYVVKKLLPDEIGSRLLRSISASKRRLRRNETAASTVEALTPHRAVKNFR